jgi:PhnB protein
MSVPDYYQPIMPYLVVKEADEFIAFIKAVFDAEEKLIVRNPDESIMHAEFSLNGGTILIGQASEAWPPFPAPMYLVTEKVDELYDRGVTQGATGNQEPGERGYGRSAGFLDQFGNQWWLNWPEHG